MQDRAEDEVFFRDDIGGFSELLRGIGAYADEAGGLQRPDEAHEMMLTGRVDLLRLGAGELGGYRAVYGNLSIA